MKQKNILQLVLSDIILASSLYEIRTQIETSEAVFFPDMTDGIEITGTGTLTADFTIRFASTPSPKEGWGGTVYWRANLTPAVYKIYIDDVDFTALLTGAANQDFQLTYLNGAWEVENLQTTIVANAPDLTGYAPVNNPTLTGTVTIPTVAGSTDNSQKAASTGFVQAVITALGLSDYAPKANPTFTGTVVVPTIAGYADNTTKPAPTSFVQNCITNLLNTISLKKILGSSPINTSATLGAGAGTGASCTITGKDIGFLVNLTTGTGCTTSADAVLINFGSAYAAAPLAFIQARNNAANNLAVGARPYPSESTTGIQLISGTIALADSTQYIFNVMVVGQ